MAKKSIFAVSCDVMFQSPDGSYLHIPMTGLEIGEGAGMVSLEKAEHVQKQLSKHIEIRNEAPVKVEPTQAPKAPESPKAPVSEETDPAPEAPVEGQDDPGPASTLEAPVAEKPATKAKAAK